MDATSGPGDNMPVDDADDTEAMTVGEEVCPEEEEEDEEEEEGEKADVTMETGDDCDNETAKGEVLALCIDKSTGSVCVWNWSVDSKSSGGSGFTLLSKSGTASIVG